MFVKGRGSDSPVRSGIAHFAGASCLQNPPQDSAFAYYCLVGFTTGHNTPYINNHE